MIPVILTVTSVLKVDIISYKNNLHGPLGITEPLTNYRVSHKKFTRTNTTKMKYTLSHNKIIKEGPFKNLIKNERPKNSQSYHDYTLAHFP